MSADDRRVYSVEQASRGAAAWSVRVWLHYGHSASVVELTLADIAIARAQGTLKPLGAEPVEISGPMLDEVERMLRGAA